MGDQAILSDYGDYYRPLRTNSITVQGDAIYNIESQSTSVGVTTGS